MKITISCTILHELLLTNSTNICNESSSAAKKKHFQMMRKMHYNEGLNIKLARQLIASELEDDEDADEEMRDDTEETREDTEEINVDPPQEGTFLRTLG